MKKMSGFTTINFGHFGAALSKMSCRLRRHTMSIVSCVFLQKSRVQVFICFGFWCFGVFDILDGQKGDQGGGQKMAKNLGGVTGHFQEGGPKMATFNRVKPDITKITLPPFWLELLHTGEEHACCFCVYF